jgi:hypothetical protein
MNEKRIHRAVSIDGVEIAGRVEGQGPGFELSRKMPVNKIARL